MQAFLSFKTLSFSNFFIISEISVQWHWGPWDPNSKGVRGKTNASKVELNSKSSHLRIIGKLLNLYDSFIYLK
jgi:hypothetical protein